MFAKIWAWLKYIFLWWKDAIVGFFTDDEKPVVETVVTYEIPTNTGGTTMKKALLVGINSYSDAPLRGCVNDVLLMYKIISEKLGFDNKNIDLITDKDCTRANILARLKKLVTGVQAGDIIYFHFSGHGSQVVVNDWTNTDEADGRDEIICPVDLDWNNPLRDNDLGAIFKILPAGVKATVVLDSCHSGTGLRNSPRLIDDKSENDWRNRFLPPPPSNILSNPLISLDRNLNFIIPSCSEKEIQTQKRGFMVDTTGQGNAVLISGCMENQTSADAWIGNRYHGALTYYLAEVLSEGGFNVPYQKIITDVNAKLINRRYTQSPQLETKKELFSNIFLK